MNTTLPSSEAVRSVGRALQLLTVFDEANPALTVSELIDRSSLPKTTVIRLIQTLEQNGFLHRRTDGRLCLGPALIRVSRSVARVWALPAAADETMEGLREQTQETVNLYVLEGRSRICVAQKEGPQNIRYVIPLGVRLPLAVGASGKVFLAHQPPAFRSRVLREEGRDEAFATALEVELGQVRERGYAVSWDERAVGVSSVSSPITDFEGRVVAALAISGPTSRFTRERTDQFGELLRRAVQRMSVAMHGAGAGYGLQPRNGRLD